MISTLVLITILLSTCEGTLVSPLNRGIMGKVSAQFLQDFAEEVTDKTSTLLKERSFSGSTSDDNWTFKYWGVNVKSLSLDPTISLRNDGSPAAGTGRLVVDGSIGGSIRASGSWSYKKSSWWYSLSLDGGVNVRASGFRIGNIVNLGKKSNGQVGFSFNSRDCSAQAGSLDVDITGSWYGWLLEIVVWLFEDDLKAALEEAACDRTNDVLRDATGNFEDAMFQRDFAFPLKTGGEMEVDFTPSIITGGSSCAVIMTGAAVDLTGQPKPPPEVITPDFINIPPTEVYRLTSSSSSSATKESRVRRDSTDWCSAVPGPSTGISVILTEDVVERLVQNIHHFDLLKFDLLQNGIDGRTITFDVSRHGRHLSTINVDFPEREGGGRLSGFELRSVKIASTAPPEAKITENGISIKVNLRARVTLFSDSPKLEIRTEFETITDWTVTGALKEQEGRYSLIPHVTASVDVWTGKLYIGAQKGELKMSNQRKLEEDNQILESIELLLSSMLEDKLALLLEEDVKSGIPLNIPLEYLTLGGADIVYREDYVLVSVDNIGIVLQ